MTHVSRYTILYIRVTIHVSCYTTHVSRLLSRVWIVAGAVMAASGWVAGLALDSLTDKADVWWTICLVRARATWLDTVHTCHCIVLYCTVLHVARHCTHVSLSQVQTVLYITTSAVPVLATDNILLDL